MVGVYKDAEASGALLHGRPGTARLLADAERKGEDTSTWADRSQLNYNGGTLHETMVLLNGAPIDPTDYSFI